MTRASGDATGEKNPNEVRKISFGKIKMKSRVNSRTGTIISFSNTLK